MNNDEVLLESDGVIIKQSDYNRLEEDHMLNDVIVNAYLGELEKQFISCHFKVFNTFFSAKIHSICNVNDDDLREQRYNQLVNWLKDDENLTDLRFLLFPCHYESHWFTVIVCNKTQKSQPQEDWERINSDEEGAVFEIEIGKEKSYCENYKKSDIGTELQDPLSQTLLDSPFKKQTTLSLNSEINTSPNLFFSSQNSTELKKNLSQLRDASISIEPCCEDYIDSPCILVIDSLKSISQTNELTNNILEFIRWEYKRKEKEKKWDEEWEQHKRILSLDVPQQNNGVDCGVFMLYFIRKFMEYTPSDGTKFKQIVGDIDPKKERLYIKNVIRELINRKTNKVMLD
ncbi:Ulp1 protease family catalytic domain containing protein [Entamoeba histolytica HM-1:IMSS-B]|uniref:Ulp1 protease family, C-terminal catalytic domain containing protein n=6 Tax=Entamoeba histolytica TaxID=5759 RepID=C4M3J5_ENTH1|nr:Ulp1 protease family, C-terminal catalytic domain containing protein [Entamoeba histolytica HM-1:IMSS]EMD49176.1 Ulp1 protease familyterminal catalytic domain containing protein [Entamoeba histolytica KU27]EMH78163.1 Ulp1 protease family catalytic domain containing protein [Entamoeba histolytica HM-1:IMSS-B]EMS16468.1 Ulp1 protease family protein [Entamoeba histolytica HM-3:IMSS]ENY60196.1 Ulp1 protease family, C-terminal catalytic domain containing protein [Entamoeba histolytica HM-1:IMSS-A|eukprot:XP_655135.1 Ulp1 protease family, C-terminal catalytic domain containing protein [Entamoeba histolytica HM-1:IMSS]